MSVMPRHNMFRAQAGFSLIEVLVTLMITMIALLGSISLLNGEARKNYDVTTDEKERFTELKSSGIPAEVVPIPEDQILRPDGQFEDVGGTARIETFWFEQEDSDL